MAKSKKGSGITKEMNCSDELTAVLKTKKVSRGGMMKGLWKYIKKNDLQASNDKRIVKCDDKLSALFKKAIRKDRVLTMRGKKIKVPAGRIYMTEMGGALSEHLS